LAASAIRKGLPGVQSVEEPVTRAVTAVVTAWFYLRRRHVLQRHREAAMQLWTAQRYLSNDFTSRASTRSRGYLLPEQLEALELLRQAAHDTLRRADDYLRLRTCYRRVREELE
jgi:hypothetical protein